MNPSPYKTHREAADYLRINRDTLRRHRERGLIRAEFIGGAWKYHQDAIAEYIAASTARQLGKEIPT